MAPRGRRGAILHAPPESGLGDNGQSCRTSSDADVAGVNPLPVQEASGKVSSTWSACRSVLVAPCVAKAEEFAVGAQLLSIPALALRRYH